MHYSLNIIIYLLTLTSAYAEPALKKPTEELIKTLLSQDLGTRSFPFHDVIHASCGKKVIPFSIEIAAHHTLLEAISQSTKAATKELNKASSPIRQLRRINEASRFFEDFFLKHLNTSPNITCEIPQNNQGKQQRTGYPDLVITHTAEDGATTHCYLDPKLYEAKSRASSLRTFYYEPRTRTNKIQHDAIHLLIGIRHNGDNGAWLFTDWEIIDLSNFNVRLKAEFQASNRDLYRPHHIIKSSTE